MPPASDNGYSVNPVGPMFPGLRGRNRDYDDVAAAADRLDSTNPLPSTPVRLPRSIERNADLGRGKPDRGGDFTRNSAPGRRPSALRCTPVEARETRGGARPPPHCGHAYSISISGSWLRIFAKSTRRPALLLYEPAAPDAPTRQKSEPLARSPSRYLHATSSVEPRALAHTRWARLPNHQLPSHVRGRSAGWHAWSPLRSTSVSRIPWERRSIPAAQPELRASTR